MKEITWVSLMYTFISFTGKIWIWILKVLLPSDTKSGKVTTRRLSFLARSADNNDASVPLSLLPFTDSSSLLTGWVGLLHPCCDACWPLQTLAHIVVLGHHSSESGQIPSSHRFFGKERRRGGKASAWVDVKFRGIYGPCNELNKVNKDVRVLFF